MKKRHFLFCLLLLYIAKNYVEITSYDPVDENFWTSRLSLSTGDNTDSASKGALKNAEGIREIAKLLTVQEKQDKAIKQPVPAHTGRDILYNNSQIAGSFAIGNYGSEMLASLGSADASVHGPSAGYEAGAYSVPSSPIAGNNNENSSAVAVERTAVAANTPAVSSASTIVSGADGSSYTLSGESGGSYTTMDDPGGPLVPPDDNDGDPGGPIDPPADNVPFDGGLSVLLTAGIVNGVRSFRQQRVKNGNKEEEA